MKDLTGYKDLLLRLWLTNGAGAVFINKLYTDVFGFDLEQSQPQQIALPKITPDDFVKVNAATLAQWTDIPVSQIEQVQSKLAQADEEGVSEFLTQLHKLNGQYTTILDANYPLQLRHIYAPPAVLTWQGNLDLPWAKSLAIVGSRNASSYANAALDMLLPDLFSADFITVSGGAVGVDSLVHQKTLAAAKQTVVVLGSGLGHVYPACNKTLFSKVAASGGAVLSIFPPDVSANKGTFPARNRIISGLTLATLVIQAAQSSGALITASYALDQNRDVLTIPGPIDDPNFVGNNKLLRAGAHFITSGTDLLQALGQQPLPQQNQISTTSDIVMPSTERDPLLDHLRNPIGLEELSQLLQLSPCVLQEQLFDLQLEGKITQTAAGLWQKI